MNELNGIPFHSFIPLRYCELNISDVVPQRTKKTDTMFQKDKFEFHFGHCFDLSEWNTIVVL